ncbi:hypothetical protein [Crassaminicella profunda]|uniref:hypothetical protein n=1 Tax=Crassaminicella profunda TaxID=1286698 RepID=UPI001CA6E8FB|nr:hypothetical protein [Crassaminicella profunda]QZY57177.1 hypothetical protein K7H06_09760 [Crassaminicella profunda]
MTHINFVMDMTKAYLDGEMDCITYSLDFPYEVEKRYRKMVNEDRDYAELIFDTLIEEGTNLFNELSDEEFKELIKKQYKYIKDVASEGFF